MIVLAVWLRKRRAKLNGHEMPYRYISISQVASSHCMTDTSREAPHEQTGAINTFPCCHGLILKERTEYGKQRNTRTVDVGTGSLF